MKDEPATVGIAMAAAKAESTEAYEHRKLRRNFIDMGRRAASEIKMLRAQIDALRPKAEAYDLLSKIVHHSLPGAPQGYSEDIAWRIEREIEQVEAEGRPPEPATEFAEVDDRVNFDKLHPAA